MEGPWLQLIFVAMSIANTPLYESVIGLEVHVQMNTISKAYSSDGYTYGSAPNTQVSPITLGHPGTLPKANIQVVKNAIKLGIACDCKIREFNSYARKNYFYPDLPKGYQITQDETPICFEGGVWITFKDESKKKIGLTRIHMEEDTGKSIHDLDPFNTLIDLNRAGVPLLEIVSEPDFRSGEEAYLYLQEVRKLVRYLNISDGNMEEGSLRCDVNISIRPKGREKFGTKVEVKNLNSFRHVQRAIDFEFERQSDLLNSGNTVFQETRTFDASKGTTILLRTKENANDYRYFIEPDLAPVRITESFKKTIAESMPPLPQDLVKRYTDELGLSKYDAELITENKETALYFEKLLQTGCSAKAGANWLMGPVQGYLNENAQNWNDWSMPANKLGELISIVETNLVSFSAASQQILPLLIQEPDKIPKTIAEDLKLIQQSDADALMIPIQKALDKYPEKVEEYRAGKKGLIGLFMGEVMKITKGSADPGITNKLLRKILDS
jgi:aspartyl-tRNA(Asn)/glutamyl-tRNA(Gln) amidotransferase subunit B